MSFLNRKIRGTDRSLIDWLASNPQQVLNELAEFTGTRGKHEVCSLPGCTVSQQHRIADHDKALQLPYGWHNQGEGILAFNTEAINDS